MEIQRVLVEQGVEEKVAKGLQKWLGPSARLLVHESSTPEGRRRAEIRNRGTEANADELDFGLLAALSSGASIEKKEWKDALVAHASFLAAGGGGGKWTNHIVAGLPMGHYELKDKGVPTGQANFSLENLTGLSAGGAALAHSSFLGARGEEMSLSQANLRGANFAHALFERANFQGADLTDCDFSGAHLAGADFRRAILKDTNFERADLRGANFAGAVTSGTQFGGANVQNIRY
jgi:uncharacterized protein YjbI with pentapeptide repeats